MVEFRTSLRKYKGKRAKGTFYAAPGRVGHSGVAVIEASRNVGYRAPIISRSGSDVRSQRHKMRHRLQGGKIEDIPREVGPRATNCTSYGPTCRHG